MSWQNLSFDFIGTILVLSANAGRHLPKQTHKMTSVFPKEVGPWSTNDEFPSWVIVGCACSVTFKNVLEVAVSC